MTGTYTVDYISLVLTAQCNCRCSYCYQTEKNARSMDWEVLQASIDFALGSQSHEINLVFLGGEPLLEISKIIRAVEYANDKRPLDKRVRYFVSTNGLLIDESVAALFAKHGFEVYLSFDGVEPAQQYRAKGTFSLLDQLLSKLKQWQPELFAQGLRICMTIVPAAVPYLADSIRYLVNKDVRDIAISPSLIFHPDWTVDRIEQLDIQFAAVWEESLQRFRERGDIPLLFFRKRSDNNGLKPANRDMCGLARGNRLAVDVDGQVYACAAMAESYQEFRSELLKTRVAPLRMGDLRDPAFWERRVSFRDAAGKIDMFKDKHLKYSSYGRCDQCEYFRQCAVCPLSIGYDSNHTDPQRVPDFICAFNRVAFKYRNRFSEMLDRFETLDELIHTPNENESVNSGLSSK